MIAQERRGFDEDSCYFYVRKHLIFMERLNNYYIRLESDYPFSGNTYEINWINDDEAHFSFGKEGERYITIGENGIERSYSVDIETEKSWAAIYYEETHKDQVKEDIVLIIKLNESLK